MVVIKKYAHLSKCYPLKIKIAWERTRLEINYESGAKLTYVKKRLQKRYKRASFLG